MNDIEQLDSCQMQIDSVYKGIVQTYSDQMDKYLDPVVPYIGSATRRKSKPWWNSDLTLLWRKARKAEKELNKAKLNRLPSRSITELKENFRQQRSCFDKVFQKEKRKFQRKWQVNLENIDVKNPPALY